MFSYSQIDPNKIEYWLESEEDWYPQDVWISSGSHLPNDKIAVEIHRSMFLKDTMLYYKLIRVDQQPIVIFEKTVQGEMNNWTLRLPDETKAVYRFGVAIQFTKNNDTLYAVRTLTVDNIDAEITLDKTRYSHEDNLKMNIWNHGLSEIAYGVMYSYQKNIGDEWKSVEWGRNWILPLYTLGHGENSTFVLDHPSFSKGLYRLVKEVNLNPDYRIEGRNENGVQWVDTKDIFAEFEVTDSPTISENNVPYTSIIMLITIILLISAYIRKTT